jgi:alpha-galactosidase
MKAMYNLQHTSLYNNKGLKAPLTRPGCWAYPDSKPSDTIAPPLSHCPSLYLLTVLQVGRLKSLAEDRSHFAAWCVVSAPLVLGHDLTNSTIVTAIKDTITNSMAIQVNQAYEGHPGALVRNSTTTFVALTAHGASGECDSPQGRKRCENIIFPTYQIWSKPQPGGAVALFIVNLSEGPNTEDIVVTLQELGFPGSKAKATDIWTGKYAGEGAHVTVAANSLGAHYSLFWLLEPTTE